jgi:O-antigen ligase
MIKKLFIAVLFLLTLGEIVRLNFGGGIILKPLDIGVGIIFVWWLALKIVKKEKIKPRQILIPVLLFTVSGAFSLLINYSGLTPIRFLISLMYLVRWVAYAGMFFVVSDFDKQFRNKISKTLIIVGALIVGIGYIQYFLYSNLRNLYYLGWDEHMFRMFSVFLDPNFAGAFFVLYFLFLVNTFFNKKSVLLGILLALTLVAVFLTFSRSALIMLIISTSLLLLLTNNKKWIFILLGVTILALSISSRYFSIENMNIFRIASSEARLVTAKEAIRIIQTRPVFGVGFNAYKYTQIKLGFRNDLNPVSHADASTDNSFLFVLATTGFVGFGLFVFMWFRILKSGIKSPLLIASVTGVFIGSFFVNSLFYSFIALWLWIVIAHSIKDQA